MTQDGVSPGTDDPGATPTERASLRRKAADLRARARGLEAKAQERLEVEQRQRGWVRTLLDAWDADRNRAGALLAGGLAYRIFLWQLPAILTALSLTNMVATISDRDPITTVERTGISAAIARVIAEALDGTDSSWWWLTLIGLAAMVWAGRGAVKALWLIGQIAYQQRQPRPSLVKAALVFSGCMVAAIALPLVVSALVEGDLVVDIVAWVVGTLITAVLVTFSMSLLPRGGLSWTVILPGAIAFVVLVRGITLASAVYFAARTDDVDDLYGAMGVAIAVQLWLYVIARLWVGSQFLNATFAGVPPGRLGEDVIVGETTDGG